MRVIAIDGPAGSGKSTVGAMYRAVAFAALRRGVDPEESGAVAQLAESIELEAGDTVKVNGIDATIEIRGPEVTRAVSTVAANPDVRKEMVRRQREWAERHDGGVVEGRDIGSVVFPDAELKVFLTASDEERAKRRSQEVLELDYDTVAADIARRDHVDATRATSPMQVADDAVVIDTSGLSIDQVVDKVLAQLKETR